MSNIHAFSLIVVVALVTMALRFFPFFVFSNRETPDFIHYLGKYLPYAIMAMLVVYCLKDITFGKAPFGIPELVCVVIVALLHIWKRNTLFSIVTGTLCYMVLIQQAGYFIK